MTKRHSIALADAIREHNRIASNKHSINDSFNADVIDTLADFCQQQNSNFNRERWLDYIAGKCGPNGEKR